MFSKLAILSVAVFGLKFLAQSATAADVTRDVYVSSSMWTLTFMGYRRILILTILPTSDSRGPECHRVLRVLEAGMY